MSSDERREYSRFANNFKVKIAKKIRKDTIKNSIAIGNALNVSGSGILLSINEKIGLGEVLRLAFLKPHTFEFFESLGKVVHLSNDQDNNYILGIDFFYLTKSEKDRLNYYISLDC